MPQDRVFRNLSLRASEILILVRVSTRLKHYRTIVDGLNQAVMIDAVAVSEKLSFSSSI